MCGRYGLYEPDDLTARFEVDPMEGLRPSYNVAPTQKMPVIVNKNGKRVLEIMQWGIPRIFGDGAPKPLFNTRADKAFLPFWKKTVTNKRCLVPANGFYEWKKVADGKQPFYIHPVDQELFAFAGIWNSWTNEKGETADAYSIMTTEANSQMKPLHDRMPVILVPEEEALWLSDDLNGDNEKIGELLHQYHDNGLELYEVSRDVNNARTNDKSLIGPINSK